VKKLAVIFAARYRDAEEVSRRFAAMHGTKYRVSVITTLDGIRGVLADLYIKVSPNYDSLTRQELYAWSDLYNEVHLRAPRNNAPVHDARKYQ
jgi:hypothetical protein